LTACRGKPPQPMPRVYAHIKPCRCPLARHRAVDWTMRTSTHRHLALWEGQQNICPISATRLAVRRAAHVMANAKQTSAASGNHGREAGYSYHVAQILKVIVPDDLRPRTIRKRWRWSNREAARTSFGSGLPPSGASAAGAGGAFLPLGACFTGGATELSLPFRLRK
jgi:hypothetical protein